MRHRGRPSRRYGRRARACAHLAGAAAPPAPWPPPLLGGFCTRISGSKAKSPPGRPLPTKLLAAGENSPFNRRDLAMESLFRRTTATGSGFDALKRLGHISPAVQSHLKHTGPLPRRLLFLCFNAISLATAILIACLPHPDLRVGLLRARRLPPHRPQRRRHPHHCRMPGRHRLPHLPPRIPAPGEEPLRLLMSAALLQGASFGPLLDLVLHLDPRILVTTFVGTAIAFGCFLGCCHHLQEQGVPIPGRLGLLCPLHSFLATQLSDYTA